MLFMYMNASTVKEERKKKKKKRKLYYKVTIEQRTNKQRVLLRERDILTLYA